LLWDADRRRNGFVDVVATLSPVNSCRSRASSSNSEAVRSRAVWLGGAKVERKWVPGPVSSLGSGAVRGSMRYDFA
jgi:hypothetical protein